jgi:diguanylate cyclase (GGDEF)-like protein
MIFFIALIGSTMNNFIFPVLFLITPLSILAMESLMFYFMHSLTFLGLFATVGLIEPLLRPTELITIYMIAFVGFILSFFIRVTVINIINDLEDKAVDLNVQNKRIKEFAFHDRLTGLPNKASFFDETRMLTENPLAHFTVLMVEINKFRLINDVYGYELGDYVLIEFADRLRNFFGAETKVFRFGDDEFMILLEEEVSENRMSDLFVAVRSMLTNSYFVHNHEIHLNISLGASMYPSLAQNVDELVSQVEFAVLNAKSKGNNFMFMFDKSMSDDMSSKMRMEANLKNAINNNELLLHYQPQVSTSTQRITGFEALVRWKSKEYGMVNPGHFIELAEEIGFINELGLWVVENSCKFFTSMKSKGIPFEVSLNISASQIIDDKFIDRVIDILRKYQVPENTICLEITESGIISNYEDAIRNMHRLKDENIKLALDDFGTGYSSLNHLKDLPVDILKIDKTFINHIHTNERDREMLKSVIQMTKNLNMICIAEGVEEVAQLEILKELKCDIIQGYLYSRPLHSSHVYDFI